jgi:hypothetical protein
MALVENAIILKLTRQCDELQTQLKERDEKLAQFEEQSKLNAPLRLEHERLVNHNVELLRKRTSAQSRCTELSDQIFELHYALDQARARQFEKDNATIWSKVTFLGTPPTGYADWNAWAATGNCEQIQVCAIHPALRLRPDAIDEPMGGFSGPSAAAPPRSAETPSCWCYACNADKTDSATGLAVTMMRMILCPTCGNKRCPHAANHANLCTDSNEPGQAGSLY